MGPKKDKKRRGGQKPVLVAIDFSEHAEAALAWAANYARICKAPLAVLHVVHEPADLPGFYRKEEESLLLPMRDAAGKSMEKFLKKARKKHPKLAANKDLSTVMLEGLPVTRILETAEKLDARLLVIGSQGRTGLPKLLLGSKAAQIVQMSPRPVVVVKHPSKGAKGKS